jgi:perosamine synthetase
MSTVSNQAQLAIQGGPRVRASMLPYGHQTIDDDDISAVTEVLRSDWLTTGPKVQEFEEALAAWVGAKYAVAFSSGTAALHGAAFACGLQAGDEAITTPLTFCATANSILYQGAQPVFADVSADTLNLDPAAVEPLIGPRTKAIVLVDYAGHPADLDAFLALAEKHNLVVIEDACHALGAEHRGRRVGSISHLSVFSFHPVKHVTTGEGGMVTTDNAEWARKLRAFRAHGIDTDARQRSAQRTWFYEMVALGFNYRISDVNCALGRSQLRKLERNLARRREIAGCYREQLRSLSGLRLPAVRQENLPAWHLYPIRLQLESLRVEREEVFRALYAENIGVNVHYIPVHLHPYYRQRFGYSGGEYPVAERAYEELLSIPMFHGMTDQDVEDVVAALRKVITHYQR